MRGGIASIFRYCHTDNALMTLFVHIDYYCYTVEPLYKHPLHKHT